MYKHKSETLPIPVQVWDTPDMKYVCKLSIQPTIQACGEEVGENWVVTFPYWTNLLCHFEFWCEGRLCVSNPNVEVWLISSDLRSKYDFALHLEESPIGRNHNFFLIGVIKMDVEHSAFKDLVGWHERFAHQLMALFKGFLRESAIAASEFFSPSCSQLSKLAKWIRRGRENEMWQLCWVGKGKEGV